MRTFQDPQSFADFVAWIVVIIFAIFAMWIYDATKSHSEREVPEQRCVDESGHFDRECP